MERILVLDQGLTNIPWTQALGHEFTFIFSKLNSAQSDFRTSGAGLVCVVSSDLNFLTQSMEHLRSTGLPFHAVAIIENTSSLLLQTLVECGYKDWFVLPVDFNQLEWKLQLHAKDLHGRMSDIGDLALEFGNFTLFPRELTAVTPRGELKVTELQAKLLIAFHSHPGKILSREWLQRRVWETENINQRTLDAHISKLKKLLPELDSVLDSVYGKGYMLNRRAA